MASGCEKVQRVAGEGHQRVRNDHEQFLEAYEKPTHIYRFLQARNSLKPLFLQRNLAYMPRHSRRNNRRYRRKFSKTNAQLNHGLQSTRKIDLASEMKSDTRLEISFCCLEKGVDYKELLEARVDRDDAGSLGTGKEEEVNQMMAEKEAEIPHGMLMEVEVLLFQFKHSNVHLSGESCPCHCSSLGKRTLEYRSGMVDQKESSVNPALTLSIPESMLTWKAKSSGGTQMLVFKASCIPKPVAKKAPVPIHLINFVSRKGCRKNVAVSLNRLSLSEIGQTKVGGIVGKQLVQSSNGCLSAEQKTKTVDKEDDEVVSVRDTLPAAVELNGMRKEDDVLPLKMQASAGFTSSLLDQELSPSSKPGTPHTHSGKSRTHQPRNHSLSTKKVTKSSKPNKRASKDVSIMTDISFGTGVIQDPTILCQSSSPPPPPYFHLHDHQYASSYNLSQTTFTSTSAGGNPPSASISNCFPTSPFLARKGFADKCTSPKLTFKNGTLNGLNGYLLPEVAMIRAGRDLSGNSMSESSRIPQAPLELVTSVVAKKKKKKKKVIKKVRKHRKYYTGSGKHGLRSFLVSVPRMYFDGLQNCDNSSSAFKGSNLSSSNVQRSLYSKNGSSYHRNKRRTQVELLQDDLKSLGQKESESDNPSSSTEDVSSQSSSLTNSNKWLCSSTRKITPINLYNSPYSSPSSKKTGGSLPNATSSPAAVNTLLNSRKRTADTSSDIISPPISADLGPPQKMPKILEDFPPRVMKTPKLLDEFPPRVMTISEQSKPQTISNKTEKVSSEDNGQKCPEPLVEVVIEEEDMDKGGQHFTESEQPKEAQQDHQQSQTVASEEHKNESDLCSILEGIYSGELVVFDSRGECLVKEGQYSILMQHEGNENGSSFEPLAWSSVLGNQDSGKQKKPKGASLDVLLKFSVSWSRGPPQHRLCSEMRTALDLQQIRDDYFEYLPPTLSSSPAYPVALTPPRSPPPLLQDMTDFVPSPAVSISVMDANLEEDMIETLALPASQEDEPEEENESTLHSPSSIVAPYTVPRKSKIVFNYLYSENGLQKTESQAGLVCPWCCLSCGKIYSLLKHMSVCHPRFHFTYMPGPKGGHVVDVHVNKLYDMTSSSMDRDPGEWNNITLARRKNGPSRCLSCTAVFVDSRCVVVKEDLSEFLNDGSWRRGYNVNRVYHHCRTCLPMLQEEKGLDKKEEKLALQWQRISSKKMIDEFTDVNEGEKELITLWNTFVMEKRIIAEKQVALACLNFAKDVGQQLIEKGLVANFMAHLVNLIEYGLILPSTLKESLRLVYNSEAGIS